MTETKTKTQVKNKAKSENKIVAPLYNQKGELLRKQPLPENIFGQKPNPTLLALSIRVYLASQKPKLATTKTRAQVAGGGRKPYRQKGTGRARAGSIRAPGRVGGGIVFGPKRSKGTLKLAKKMRSKALTSALSIKARESAILLIDKLSFKEPKTKKASEILKRIGLEGKRSVGLVLEEKNSAVQKSFRNLPSVQIQRPLDLNSFSVLKSSSLIFTLEALEKLKNRFEKSHEKSN